jgi:hypothetical protein
MARVWHGRSDSGLCAVQRRPAPLIIPSAVGPPARERARPCRSRCSAQRPNDLDRHGLVCWARPGSTADGMIRPTSTIPKRWLACSSWQSSRSRSAPRRERFYRRSLPRVTSLAWPATMLAAAEAAPAAVPRISHVDAKHALGHRVPSSSGPASSMRRSMQDPKMSSRVRGGPPAVRAAAR